MDVDTPTAPAPPAGAPAPAATTPSTTTAESGSQAAELKPKVVPVPGTPGADRDLFLTDDLARWWETARSCVRDGEPVFHVRHPTQPVRFRLVPEWDDVEEPDLPPEPPRKSTLEEDIRAGLADAEAGRAVSIEEFRAEMERRHPELKVHREEQAARERRDRARRDAERADWERDARRRP